MGGSRRTTLSTTAPAARAIRAGTATRGGATSAAAQIDATSSVQALIGYDHAVNDEYQPVPADVWVPNPCM